MIGIARLEAEYADDIARLNKMNMSILTMNVVEYAHNRLMQLRPPLSAEFLLEVETLTTALMTSYARLFNGSEGATALNASNLPGELRPIHDEIMSYRNKRYAHHGAHPSISSRTQLIAAEDGVLVDLELSIDFYVGAAAHWAALFHWVRGHIYDNLYKRLEYLSGKSGVTWRIREGAQPPWAIELDT